MIYLIYLAVDIAAFIYGVKHDRREYTSTVKDIFGNIKETKIEKNCAVILQCIGARK